MTESAELLGTFDLHPMNVVHEIAWILPLLNGESGKYANAVPLNARGVRTLFKNDKMSQHESWQAAHADRPGIEFLILPGSHLTLALPEIQAMRHDRFTRLLNQMKQHNFKLPDVDFNYVINNRIN